MTRYVAIPGTHATDGTTADASQWWQPDSPWARYLAGHGWRPACVEPFAWSGDVDGDFPWPWAWGSRRHADWEAGGAALCYYLRSLGDVSDVVLIAHSHGGNLAKAALARATAPHVRALCTVCTPVRRDMDRAAMLARTNVDRWLHITDPAPVANRWQALGSLFDGGWGWSWDEPRATRTDRVAGLGIGHSGVLSDPKHFDLWRTRGWLHELGGSADAAGHEVTPDLVGAAASRGKA